VWQVAIQVRKIQSRAWVDGKICDQFYNTIAGITLVRHAVHIWDATGFYVKTDAFYPDVILFPTTGSRLSRVKLAKLPEAPRYRDLLNGFALLRSCLGWQWETLIARTTMSILFYLIFMITFFFPHGRTNCILWWYRKLRDDRGQTNGSFEWKGIYIGESLLPSKVRYTLRNRVALR